jgi:hypothetical protein
MSSRHPLNPPSRSPRPVRAVQAGSAEHGAAAPAGVLQREAFGWLAGACRPALVAAIVAAGACGDDGAGGDGGSGGTDSDSDATGTSAVTTAATVDTTSTASETSATTGTTSDPSGTTASTDPSGVTTDAPVVCEDLGPALLGSENLDRVDPMYASTAWGALDLATSADLNKWAVLIPQDGDFFMGTSYVGAVEPAVTPWIREGWARTDLDGRPVALAGCADPATGPRVPVAGTIADARAWSCDQVYELDGVVTITGSVAVAPGTVVLARPGAALVVADGGELAAAGTADAGVLFTASAAVDGMAAPGDWGGIVMIGKSPTNAGAGVGTVEALPGAPLYGGGDGDDYCGRLNFVRIEYGGGTVAGGGELPGALSLFACGQNTRISHVQAHRSATAGLAVLGGDTDMDHVFVTGARGDGLAIREGYSADMQFVVVQQDPAGGGADVAIENNTADPGANPVTRPRIANLTTIGGGPEANGLGGIELRAGTRAELYNSTVVRATAASLRVVGLATKAEFDGGDIVIRGNLFFGGAALASCIE